MLPNPFCEMADDGIPLFELKQGLVLYLKDPPKIATVSRVYDHYLKCCSERIQSYRSTAQGETVKEWDAQTRSEFEGRDLPGLYKMRDWGYIFSDGKDVDSWLFMFHGFRPNSESGKASFFRFDFDWQIDETFLLDFAQKLIEITPFLSGFGGYFLQSRGDLRYASESYDRIFAIANRYWGIEAHNLDVTVNHVLNGYKCVNWLTFIGEPLRAMFPAAIRSASAAASWFSSSEHGTLIQAEPHPGFGDRNRKEILVGYEAVARALEPLQVREHGALGGAGWTDENTIEYIRRFTAGAR